MGQRLDIPRLALLLELGDANAGIHRLFLLFGEPSSVQAIPFTFAIDISHFPIFRTHALMFSMMLIYRLTCCNTSTDALLIRPCSIANPGDSLS